MPVLPFFLHRVEAIAQGKVRLREPILINTKVHPHPFYGKLSRFYYALAGQLSLCILRESNDI